MLEKQILGKVVGHVWVIEWQKSGLPHCHMLLWMADRDTVDTPEQNDQVISARVPYTERLLRYFNLVKDGSCSKHFPKGYCDKTKIGEKSNSQYARRSADNGGFSFVKKRIRMDDAWIVPHNAFLLLLMSCRINLEKVVSCRAISYIFKYIFKGSDRSLVYVSPAKIFANNQNRKDVDDEVQRWIDVRYFSSHEACYKAFGFSRSQQKLSVVSLNFHLPNAQRVTFRLNDEGRRAVQDEFHSTLLAAFELNLADTRANPLLHIDLPKHYRYQKGVRRARKSGEEEEGLGGLKRGNQVGLLPGVLNISRN